MNSTISTHAKTSPNANSDLVPAFARPAGILKPERSENPRDPGIEGVLGFFAYLTVFLEVAKITKVVVELTIAPSGAVSAVDIVTSELDDKALEGKLALRIKRFKFSQADVAESVVTYPIDLLPYRPGGVQ